MANAGLTLLEMAVVIAVLLALAAITMIGARAWRRGVDRAACVITIRNVQTSVRAYQNMYGYTPGTMPYADGGTQSIADHLVAKGYIATTQHEMIKGLKLCPGGGDYVISREDVFPVIGNLYLECSLESSRKHLLTGSAEW